MPHSPTILLPDLLWTGARFLRGLAVHILPDGTIGSVERRAAAHVGIELPHHALLPGFVNVHSHAFQRGLRTQPQLFDTGSGNFWSWRDTMYALADALDPDEFYLTSRQCFEEMLDAGMTSVGEFHYLHHAGLTHDDWAFDSAVVAAARDAGIRLVLIQTYYATGDIGGKPLEGAQRRFYSVSRERFVKQFERLAASLDARTQTPAIACHSIRAAPPDDLVYFRDYSFTNNLPFHIHVEEARKEITDCRAAYGVGPLRLMLDKLKVDETFTSIHCTHSSEADLIEYCARGGRVCLCPITEGNLSDGFPDVPTIRECGGKLCFGTDSNIRICATEELRWMEFAQRLRREARGIIVDTEGRSAAKLMQVGTLEGARALNLRAGEIAPGALADLIAIDLDDPNLRGAEESAIGDSLIFGGGNSPITHVWVGGQRVRGK